MSKSGSFFRRDGSPLLLAVLTTERSYVVALASRHSAGRSLPCIFWTLLRAHIKCDDSSPSHCYFSVVANRVPRPCPRRLARSPRRRNEATPHSTTPRKRSFATCSSTIIPLFNPGRTLTVSRSHGTQNLPKSSCNASKTTHLRSASFRNSRTAATSSSVLIRLAGSMMTPWKSKGDTSSTETPLRVTATRSAVRAASVLSLRISCCRSLEVVPVGWALPTNRRPSIEDGGQCPPYRSLRHSPPASRRPTATISASGRFSSGVYRGWRDSLYGSLCRAL